MYLCVCSGRKEKVDENVEFNGKMTQYLRLDKIISILLNRLRDLT